MRRMTSLAFIFLQAMFSAGALAEPVSITTMNIEFYGQNRTSDSRDATIREFFTLAETYSDVFAFEEIVDVPGLERNLLQNRYKCHSYNHSNRGHQHVVICVRNGFTFVVAKDDNNYTYENVALANLRPAVHGILKNSSGRELAHIVAVHLKAMPNEGATRSQQVKLLANNLNNRGDDLPVVFLGDMNSYNNDVENFTEIFSENDVSLAPLEMPFYTYRTSRYQSVFDWIMVTDDVDNATPVQVSGPCNDSWSSGTAFDDLAYYNQKVSDHCPVSTILDL
jgi:endonuclease/exonuclease/phosphatase family metal-dependent hydrolase